MNQALYSVYSYPNTVLAIFGGLLIDRFLGLRKATILFTGLTTLGAAVFYIGVLSVSYPLLVVGRVLFGLGSESLCVAQSAWIARWFVKGGRGMALAFGITLSFSRIGSSFNFLFSPVIAEKAGIDMAVFCGLVACVISFASCFALVLMDVYGTAHGYVAAETAGQPGEGESFHLRDILRFPAMLWVLCFICVMTYSAILPFIGVAENFFVVKFDMKEKEASSYVSLYQFTSAGVSPLVGALVDVLGRFTQMQMLSVVGYMSIFVSILLTRIPPAAITPLFGIVHALFVSALWPAVPYLVDKSLVGLAFGTMTSIQNMGLATLPLMVGAVLDHYTPPANCTSTELTALVGNVTVAPSDEDCPVPLPTMEGFNKAIVLLLGLCAISLLLCASLHVMDMRSHHILSASAAQRKASLEAQEKKLLMDNDEDDADAKAECVNESTALVQP